MPADSTSFTAIVLAADRAPGDPVARAAGSSCKALAPVDGTPMVERVLVALNESREVNARLLCGPPPAVYYGEHQLQRWLAAEDIPWVPSEAAPSRSAMAAMRNVPAHLPVLLTTADHALLSPAIVDHFCREARLSGCDALVGLARHSLVVKAYPSVRRTVIRLRDDAYCGCNLFAFLTPEARRLAEYWRRVERQRKKPLRVVGAVGWLTVLQFLAGRLSLGTALERLSRRAGVRVGAVKLPFPDAAVDVDTMADWQFVEDRAREMRLHPS